MFHMSAPAWQIVVRTLVVYTALLAGLRLMGKREIGQMTVFDLIVLLVLSNAVQNAMVGTDTSITAGLIAAGCLLAINRLVDMLRLQSPKLRRAIEGEPTVLISQGHYLEDAVRREGLGHEEVEMALREHGLVGAEQVRLAVLELDGSISVVPQETGTVRIHRQHHKFLTKG